MLLTFRVRTYTARFFTDNHNYPYLVHPTWPVIRLAEMLRFDEILLQPGRKETKRTRNTKHETLNSSMR